MQDCTSCLLVLSVLGAPAACSPPERRMPAMLVGSILALGLRWVLASAQQRIALLSEGLGQVQREVGEVRALLGRKGLSGGRPGSRKYCGLRSDPLGPEAPPGPRTWSLNELPAGWFSKLQSIASQEELDRVSELRQRLLPDDHKFTRVRREELQLLRFLRARKGNVDAAEKMFRHAAKRLTAVDAIGLLTAEDVSKARELDEYWKPMGVMGLDHEGHPILWENLGHLHIPSFVRLGSKSIEQMERMEFYVAESILAACEEEMVRQDRPILGVTHVENLRGLSKEHMNLQAMKVFKAAARIGQDCYPETVKRIVVVNAPWIFPAVWGIAKHFFDAGTREKIQVVPQREMLQTLKKYIPEASIPVGLGGTLRVGGDDECNTIIMRGGPIPDDLLDSWSYPPRHGDAQK